MGGSVQVHLKKVLEVAGDLASKVVEGCKGDSGRHGKEAVDGGEVGGQGLFQRKKNEPIQCEPKGD